MIHSMTGFARVQEQAEWGSLVCEIRSINHRYLELSVHLPDVLRVFEMPVREQIRQHIKRGKVECVVRYQRGADIKPASLWVNMPLAQELCMASEKIAAFLRQPGLINPADILRFPGVLETKETELSVLQTPLFQLTALAIDELAASRSREGEELSRLFLQRMSAIKEALYKVRERLPVVMTEQNNRLRKRFAEIDLNLDGGRLEQEIVLFAQKIDVAEEIERTETHVSEIKRILQEGGMVGRRLDFLLQELNREANTLGSKSVDSVVTHAAVEMKVLIEQVREQVQNVE